MQRMKIALEPKKEQLLKAVIQEHIQTASPVASLSLGGRLEASSATLRNWMSELETLGYLKQPHASSGRIPTDYGYRHYVDALLEQDDLPAREKRRIQKAFESGVREIEDLIAEAAEIIATIAGCTALAVAPAHDNFILKYLQLVRVAEEKTLLILVTRSGLMVDRLIDIAIPADRLEMIANILNDKLAGHSLSQIGPHLLDGIADEIMTDFLKKIAALIEETVEIEKKNRMLIEGTHYLLEQPEFRDLEKMKTALGLFHQNSRLSKFLRSAESLNVYIGVENPLKDLQNFTVIAAPYGGGELGQGTIAVLGPTRMNYDRLIPLMRFASLTLSARIHRLFF